MNKLYKSLSVLLVFICLIVTCKAMVDYLKLKRSISEVHAMIPLPVESPISEDGFSIITPATPSSEFPQSPVHEYTVNPCSDFFSEFRFAEGLDKYPDAKFWIRIKNTNIDYPVLYGPDNEYYLHHLADGTMDEHGTLYTDIDCLPDFESQITIIYGHNMADGTMFHDLMNYKNQIYVDAYPYVCIYSKDKCYVAELFAGVFFHGERDTLYGNFTTDEEFISYVNFLIDNSIISRDMTITSNDKLIAMCTCTYEYDNGRYVLYAKLNEVEP